MSGAQLDRIQVHHVRNLTSLALGELQRVNVFFGRNGSGKTSILEAIHLLAMARSFRGSIKTLVSHGEQEATVFGQLQPGKLSIGVRRDVSGDVTIKLGGETVRTVAALAEQLPVQVINADSFDLLTGAPGARRQYLDWGVFHVEQGYQQAWQRFQKSIKQRNSLLRHGKIAPVELRPWSQELAQAGEQLHSFREAYFQRLCEVVPSLVERLAPGLEAITLSYRRGWDREAGLLQALEASEAADREQGYTHVGPQRADIRILCSGRDASETLSRGQQKLVVCALKLAQGRLLQERGRHQSIYLVDDLASELDAAHCRRVCAVLSELDAQVFITSISKEEIAGNWPEPGLAEIGAVFHVEQGRITPE